MRAHPTEADVVIIGAGPAGSTAAALLARAGRSVVVYEASSFPRFVIGESLLPRCNQLLARAGTLAAIENRGYQLKRGATFHTPDGRRARIDFSEGLPGEPPSTFHVPRADFDLTLALEARKAGAELRYRHRLSGLELDEEGARVAVDDLEQGCTRHIRARFVLDASGYGRALPRLLGTTRPSDMPVRLAAFSHFEGDRRSDGPEAGDVWINTHPDGGWAWLIPFANGRCGCGVVIDPERWEALPGSTQERLLTLIGREPHIAARLADAIPVSQAGALKAWSCGVAALFEDRPQPRWALAGNTAGFIDPIFSSGVSLALESASLAAPLVDAQLGGAVVDWDQGYRRPVERANGVFRAFVESWYSGELLDIILASDKPARYHQRITSILAGHVLDPANVFVRNPVGSLNALHNVLQ